MTADDNAPQQEAASEDVAQAESAIPPEVEKALRKANKEAETLRLKLKAFEDRDKSEAERLAERAETAEKRAAEVELRALRNEVAISKGLTASQAKRLIGSTEDELLADADQLLADMKSGRSVPDVDQGVRGETPAKAKPDMNHLIRVASGRS